jgi:hypothetical protein
MKLLIIYLGSLFPLSWVTMFSPLNGLVLLILFAEIVSGCVPWRGSLLIEESAVLQHEKLNADLIFKKSKIYVVQKDSNYITKVETRMTGQLNIYSNS